MREKIYNNKTHTKIISGITGYDYTLHEFNRNDKINIDKNQEHYKDKRKGQHLHYGGHKSIPFDQWTSKSENELMRYAFHHDLDPYMFTYNFTRNPAFIPSPGRRATLIYKHQPFIASELISRRNWHKHHDLFPRGYLTYDRAWGNPNASPHYHGVCYLHRKFKEQIEDVTVRHRLNMSFRNLSSSICFQFHIQPVTYNTSYVDGYSKKHLPYADRELLRNGDEMIMLPKVKSEL